MRDRALRAALGVSILFGGAAGLSSPVAVAASATAPAPAPARTPAPPAPHDTLPHHEVPSGIPGYNVRDVCADRGPATWRCFAKQLVAVDGRADTRRIANGGYTPADLGSAYKLNQNAGAGQTVAIIEGYRVTTMESDLAIYRSTYGLPPCTTANGCLAEINQKGQTSPLPGTDPNDPNGSAIETALDVDMVSAVCPNCHIVVVEAKDLLPPDILAAVDAARSRPGVTEISISLGGDGEPTDEAVQDQLHFRNSRGIAITVAAGDCGYGASYPAASPYVTSVGGTSLVQDAGNPRGWSETTWNNNATGQGCNPNVYPGGGADATGSACTNEPAPAWQPARFDGCTDPNTGGPGRVMNDIAASADPTHPESVYVTCAITNSTCMSGFGGVGGTSAAAPIIAGVYALGGGEGFATGAAPLYAAPAGSFFDVTTDEAPSGDANFQFDCGSTLCHAGPGFDAPTGLGTPNGSFTPVPTPPQGYWLVARDGGIFPFGKAGGYGSTGGMHLNQPIVGMASTETGGGYWLVASDGGIFPFGDAVNRSYGSMGGRHLNMPIVGMAATKSGHGYWLVASDGGIFPFGDANLHSHGSTGGIHLNQPIVGMAATPSGDGYYLVASDGGLFPFGDANNASFGSEGGHHLNQPIVGMAVTLTGHGYWLVATDGGMFPFGDACGCGSEGGTHLNQPIVGMARTPTSTVSSGNGYWLVAADGGIFPHGDAVGLGSEGGSHLNQPIVGMASNPHP